MNDLNLKLLLKLFPNDFDNDVVLDYDNTICLTGKQDATYTYYKESGYQPGVGLIGSKVVYVANRNGNSAAHILQEETLERMFIHLANHDIKVNKFRADSASYTWPIFKTINKYSDTFFVKVRMSQVLYKAISSVEKWTPIGDSEKQIFRGETTFTPFEQAAGRAKEKHLLKTYRLVITKAKRDDGQINIFTSEPFTYSPIATNDMEMTMDEVVCFYNQRGAIEREFEVLKYDFGWNKLPFSKLCQNNAYFIIMAMCRNLYHYMIAFFAAKTDGLQANYRLKKFIFRFITIPAKWVKHGRQMYLKLFGEIAFKT